MHPPAVPGTVARTTARRWVPGRIPIPYCSVQAWKARRSALASRRPPSRRYVPMIPQREFAAAFRSDAVGYGVAVPVERVVARYRHGTTNQIRVGGTAGISTFEAGASRSTDGLHRFEWDATRRVGWRGGAAPPPRPYPSGADIGMAGALRLRAEGAWREGSEPPRPLADGDDRRRGCDEAIRRAARCSSPWAKEGAMGDELSTGCTEYGLLAALRQARQRRVPVVLLRAGPVGRGADGTACAALGRRLRSSVRATDPVCWLGEEGYAVLLLGAGPGDGDRVADRLSGVLGVPISVAILLPDELTPATLRCRVGPVAIDHARCEGHAAVGRPGESEGAGRGAVAHAPAHGGSVA